jgi:hypothetical protein
VFDFLVNAIEVEATVLEVGFWHIWEARNDVRNNGGKPDPRRVCAKTRGTRHESSTHFKWSPPPPGEVLVNCDAALFDDRRNMAMGMVIRDDSGDCLVSASLPLQGFTSPKITKALALRQAVLITRDRCFQRWSLIVYPW